jgi:deazaflavin-dependent oxidoreductase (nitroreductase family)
MGTETKTPTYRAATPVEAAFNRVMGFLAGLGIGPRFIYLLQVRGRKTGRMHSAPVNLMAAGGKRFLVAPRGRTQWVRNAEAAGEITLKRGTKRQNYQLIPVSEAEKPEILKMYLDRYASAVQKFFPIPAGSESSAFRPIAANYPVFELVAS